MFMKRFIKFLVLFFGVIFLISSCSGKDEKKLRNIFKEGISVKPKYQEGQYNNVIIDQYIEMEQNLNYRFVSNLSELIDNSFEKQLEKFKDEELGFFSNYHYMWKYIFADDRLWEDELSLKKDKYFNSIDIEQEALYMYKKHVAEIEKLRSSFYVKSTGIIENIEIDLPEQDIYLGSIKQHTKKNIFIEFATEGLVWLLIWLIVIILALTIGWVLPGINIIIFIISLIMSIILSIKNDNKAIESLRIQHNNFTINKDSILNELNENTIHFYESYL